MCSWKVVGEHARHLYMFRLVSASACNCGRYCDTLELILPTYSSVHGTSARISPCVSQYGNSTVFAFRIWATTHVGLHVDRLLFFYYFNLT